MGCRRKTKGDRELVADARKRFNIFCESNESCSDCDLDKSENKVTDSCEINYIIMLMKKE